MASHPTVYQVLFVTRLLSCAHVQLSSIMTQLLKRARAVLLMAMRVRPQLNVNTSFI